MKTKIFFLSLIIVASCTTLKVTSDYDKDIDFRPYKSYKVMYYANMDDARNDDFAINDINRKRIEKALRMELDNRGLEYSEQPQAVFLYAVDIDIQKSYTANTTINGGTYMGYRGRFYGGYGMGEAYTTVDEQEYEVGKLRIGMIDAKNKKLIWIGEAADEVKQNVKDPDEKVKKIVNKIMEQYPIPIPEEE